MDHEVQVQKDKYTIAKCVDRKLKPVAFSKEISHQVAISQICTNSCTENVLSCFKFRFVCLLNFSWAV